MAASRVLALGHSLLEEYHPRPKCSHCISTLQAIFMRYQTKYPTSWCNAAPFYLSVCFFSHSTTRDECVHNTAMQTRSSSLYAVRLGVSCMSLIPSSTNRS